MRVSWELATVVAALLSCTSALPTTTLSNKSSLTKSLKATITSSPPSKTSLAPCGPCGTISSSFSAYFSVNPTATNNPAIPASLAMECLESVPLDLERSLAFVEYITPYIEFQSTIAYLKDPPTGFAFNGVDLLGGLCEIAEKLRRGQYNNQYCFEKELFILINVLPRDFHFNLPMPLVSLFSFSTEQILISVSIDGISIPQVYSAFDLGQVWHPNKTLSWTPSPVVSINGLPAADVLLTSGLNTQQYSDPDAIYNLMFPSIALIAQNNGNAWQSSGGHTFGFDSDTTTYVFANGSTLTQENIATTTQDFGLIDSPAALFEVVEIPTTTIDAPAATTTDAPATTTITSPPKVTTTSVEGYPTTIIMHPDGYTSGYFLPNSSIAVLVISAFANAAETVEGNFLQQQVITKFLAACKTAGKTQLIVDLQANGGGSVYNGIDAFKQLFPSVEPFGATRFRYNPYMAELSELYSVAGVFNGSVASVYQTQADLDVNLQDFKNYSDLIGPYDIYGDHFSALVRENLTDTTAQIPNGLIVSGYANETHIAPQLFASEDIVLIYDGACGSTCAVFSELMKSQGGVRSVAVGGRPKPGPMQGVAGSKGAQVFTYGNVQGEMLTIVELYNATDAPLVPTLEAFFETFANDPPLGPSLSGPENAGRFNLRNNFNSSDPSEVPLEFIYEAANCRLYYQPQDLFDITGLWDRVADVTWSGKKCVRGSTVSADDTMPSYSWQTLPFGPGAAANFTLDARLPGNLVN